MKKVLKTSRAKSRGNSSLGAFISKHLGLISLIVFIAIALAMLFVCTLKLNYPLVITGIFVVLEALLAALLHRIPVWVHGLVIVAMIVAGICLSNTVFMILMAVVYVAATGLLYLWTADKE